MSGACSRKWPKNSKNVNVNFFIRPLRTVRITNCCKLCFIVQIFFEMISGDYKLWKDKAFTIIHYGNDDDKCRGLLTECSCTVHLTRATAELTRLIFQFVVALQAFFVFFQIILQLVFLQFFFHFYLTAFTRKGWRRSNRA